MQNVSDSQRVSHLTTGSFSLTPSVRSTNIRNGFRLCEPVKVNGLYAHLLAFDDRTYLEGQ